MIKPLQGVIGKEGPGDATVIKPLEDSFKGIALTTDVNPRICQLDPKQGAMSALDECFRNLVAVGAKPHSLADCLNYGNPEKPDRLGDFKMTAEGFNEVARALGIPFVSGNVSFYNETGRGPIKPTPTVLACGLIEDVRQSITMDLKDEGNIVFLVGDTKDEMGGSEYYHLNQGDGGDVPSVDVEALDTAMEDILACMDKRLVKSCHDISTGGLAVALAEMCIAGDMGIRVDVDTSLRADVLLFSESNTRWLVEVAPNKAEKFMAHCTTPVRMMGIVGRKKIRIAINGKERLDVDVRNARNIWKKTLGNKMV